jgi:dihydroxyacetone kinase
VTFCKTVALFDPNNEGQPLCPGGPLAAAEAAAKAATEGCENTKNMVARAGRSSYINAAAQAGVPDPGAFAVAAWAAAAATSLKAHLPL